MPGREGGGEGRSRLARVWAGAGITIQVHWNFACAGCRSLWTFGKRLVRMIRRRPTARSVSK